MKAIIFNGELKFVNDYSIPEPGQGEALIRVLLAGICNTDLEITKGYQGFRGVIGHEFVGVVEKIYGDDRQFMGKRVVGEINCGCGECEYCRAGLKRHCPSRITLGIAGKDGALAEYTTLPVDNLFVVPANVKDEEAVFTEPLAAAFEILEQIHVRPNDTILVLGDGKLGILVGLVLHLFQAEILLAGNHEEKLAVARDQGVPTTKVGDLVAKKAFDIVVDATGSPDGLQRSMEHVRPRGTVVLKTTAAGRATIDLAPVVVDEVRIIGSRCGSFAPALKALSEKRIRVGQLISAIYSFSRAAEAFTKAKEKGSLKVLIDFT